MWKGFYEKSLRDRKSQFPRNLIMLNLNLPASPQLQLFWKCEQSHYEVLKATKLLLYIYMQYLSLHTKKVYKYITGKKKQTHLHWQHFIMKRDMEQPSEDTRVLIPNNMYKTLCILVNNKSCNLDTFGRKEENDGNFHFLWCHLAYGGSVISPMRKLV